MADKDYMQLALSLAANGAGYVNPNPLVGAVVVKDGTIIGQGYHKKYGGPHAEVYALDEAGADAAGASLYVTLEPCSHYGKTPPCAKKIIESGIRRCIIAMEDPNELVAGRGIEMLCKAGIEVTTGLCKKEAEQLNRIFLKYINSKMPFLFLKAAITLDGKIAARSLVSKWITNEKARFKVQCLRHKYMAIMIGINTLLQDNPSLTARIENGNNPYRIIVDPHVKTKPELKIFSFNDKKNIIISSEEEKKSAACKALKEKGAEFIYLKGHNFSFKTMLEKIGALGIDSVLLEGGSSLISAAFKEDIIDGGEIFIAPKILGDEKAIPFVNGFAPLNMEEAISLSGVKINTYGDNCSMEFYKDGL